MYVEDIILHINEYERDNPKLDTWWSNFLISIAYNVNTNKPLTTSQATYVIKLIKIVLDDISSHFDREQLEKLITYPVFKYPLVETLEVKKEVKRLCGNVLGFRSKIIPDLNFEMKKLATNSFKLKTDCGVRYFFDERMWVVHVYPSNISDVLDIIHKFDFPIGEDVKDTLYEVCSPLEYRTKIELIEEGIYAPFRNGMIIQYIENVMGEDGYSGLIDATPSNARHLLKLSKITNCEVESTIQEIANIEDIKFNHAEDRDAITFAKDMNYRCIFPTSLGWESALRASYYTKEEPIILTDISRTYANEIVWSKRAKSVGLSNIELFPCRDNLEKSLDKLNDMNFIKKNKNRPIIIDWNSIKEDIIINSMKFDGLSALCREFNKTMIYGNVSNYDNIWGKNDLARLSILLYPHHYRLDDFLIFNRNYAENMKQIGFNIKKPAEIAFLFGIWVS